jgi:uncharacterized iron-regulated membrane protein
MKVFFRRIHLYLGLTAGIVISITCFTGATLVFEKELQSFFYPERYYVEPGNKRFSAEELIANLGAEIPGAKITGIKIHGTPDRTVEITFTEDNGGSTMAQGAVGGAGSGPVSNVAFMNPYTGKVESLYTHRNSFFFAMFSLHRWLLAGDVGKMIVGVSTSIFLFILITGFILWWPAKQKKLKQRLKVKLNAGWKRLNHDLHISVGFYAAVFLFIFAFTGLAWSFEWFNNAIYAVTGTENKRPEPPTSVYDSTAPRIGYDRVFSAVQAIAAEAQYFNISPPRDSAATYSITVLAERPAHEKASDQYFVDQYSGKIAGTYLYSDRNFGQRVRSTFYPVHVGSIAGLPGRIIALLACVAGFTFPITGTILWVNRLRKKEKKKDRKAISKKYGKAQSVES